MSTDPTKRQPAGIPVGGQFASHDRAEAATRLPSERSPEIRELTDLVRLRATARDEATRQWDLANASYVRQALIELHPDAIGAEFIQGWSSGSFELRSLWGEKGKPIAVTEKTLGAIGWALLDLQDRAVAHLGDAQRTDQGTALTMSVRQPIMSPADQARASLTTASHNAGLDEVMPAMLGVLVDRGDQDVIETIAILEEDDITELYEDVVGPAADHLEAFVRNIAKRNEISARELSYDQKIMEEGR